MSEYETSADRGSEIKQFYESIYLDFVGDIVTHGQIELLIISDSKNVLWLKWSSFHERIEIEINNKVQDVRLIFSEYGLRISFWGSRFTEIHS